MKDLFLSVLLVHALTVVSVKGQLSSVECILCSSTTYQDVGYSDLVSVFEDHQCELGVGHVLSCAVGFACITIIGTETRRFTGYGNIDLHVVIRDCVDMSLLGTDPSGCVEPNQQDAILSFYPLGPGTEFVSFDGDICYCNTNVCNNVMAPPINRLPRPHTPPPDAPGLQCRLCSHTDFHDFELSYSFLSNVDCEDGELISDQVYYITCFPGSVCVNIRGETRYTSEGFVFTADYHERRCLFPDMELSTPTGCLSDSVVNDAFDTYSFTEGVEFTGGICYCNASLCDCDPEACYTEPTAKCADHDFCPGENEVCVDSFPLPRCECVEGYEFDDYFQCQSVAVQCITCISRHYVSDYTTNNAQEDINCERGLGVSYSCLPDSVCATVLGTETRHSESYGDVIINVVLRGCERRSLFDGNNRCLNDPRSADILHIEDEEFPRTSFTGEACYCAGNDCNSNIKEFDRTIHPHYPDEDVAGLQCIFCYSRYFIDDARQPNTLDAACVDGDLTSPDVSYVTCRSDDVCVKIHGNFSYFLDGELARAVVIERRCLPKVYTSGGDQGCLVMDEIKDNLQYDYSSYYFYFDTLEIDAPACYCSSDVCDCDTSLCLQNAISCDDGDFCNDAAEYCSDTVNGPECLCKDGFERNELRECSPKAEENCASLVCSRLINRECMESDAGPRCVCNSNYRINPFTNQCTVRSRGSSLQFVIPMWGLWLLLLTTLLVV